MDLLWQFVKKIKMIVISGAKNIGNRSKKTTCLISLVPLCNYARKLKEGFHPIIKILNNFGNGLGG